MMLGCVLCSFMSTTSGSLRPGPALQWAAPGAKVFDAQMRGYTYTAIAVYCKQRHAGAAGAEASGSVIVLTCGSASGSRIRAGLGRLP